MATKPGFTSSADREQARKDKFATRKPITPTPTPVATKPGFTSSADREQARKDKFAKVNPENDGYTEAQVAKGRAQVAANKAAAVAANKTTTVPATPKTTPRTARPSPISSSYGSSEDATRQSAIDENEKYFRDRGVKPLSGSGTFKSGGAVKSKIDGCAVKGKTRGKYC
jgi:hypothetical protein